VFECWKEIEAYGSIRSFRSSLSVPNGVLGHRFLGVKSGVRAQWGFGSQLLQIRSNPRCRYVMVEIDVKVYVKYLLDDVYLRRKMGLNTPTLT
jgi:hypothetical protein